MAKIKPQTISFLTILVLSFQCRKLYADGKLIDVKSVEEIHRKTPPPPPQLLFKSGELFEEMKKQMPFSLPARSLRGVFASHGGSKSRRRRRRRRRSHRSGGSGDKLRRGSRHFIAINVSMVLVFLFFISWGDRIGSFLCTGLEEQIVHFLIRPICNELCWSRSGWDHLTVLNLWNESWRENS